MPTPYEVRGLTGGTAMGDPVPGVRVQVGVVCGPRFQALVDPLQQQDVVRVIAGEVVPRAFFALHAAQPEVLTRMRELTADREDGAQIIEFIAIELEKASRCDQRIKGLKWTTGLQFMEQESGEAFLYVEINVMGDDDIGLIQDAPEVPH